MYKIGERDGNWKNEKKQATMIISIVVFVHLATPPAVTPIHIEN